MTKKKKVKKSKQTRQDPFSVGLDVEQVLADSLCAKFLKAGVEEDAIDEAFIGAFQGLAHRMLTIFNTEFVLEQVGVMAQMIAEENGEVHVCDDCQAKEKSGSVSKEVRNKMH
jgi:hypothetical protein